MKKVTTIIGAVFFASLILSGCGGSASKDDGAKVDALEDQAASPSKQDASTPATEEDAPEEAAAPEDLESMDGITESANKTVEDAKKNADKVMQDAKKNAEKAMKGAGADAEKAMKDAMDKYKL